MNQSKAQNSTFPDYSIKPHDQDTNFCQVIFTIDGEEHRQAVDVREKFNTIFCEDWTPGAGTNFLLTLNIAWIEKGTNRSPLQFKGGISLGAYSSTNESPQTCIGTSSWDINFDPANTNSNIAPFSVTRSSLDQNRSIYFCQFRLLQPVRIALTNGDTPEDICIWMTAGNVLIHLTILKKDWELSKGVNEPEQTQLAPAKKASPKGKNKDQSSEISPPGTEGTVRSDIASSNSSPVLGIVLQGGYVLINSSPATTHGILEEANPETYPLVWQPVIESSNTPVGWQMPLKSGAKLFRLKLPNSQP